MHSRSKRHSLCVEQLESRALLIALQLTPQQTAVDAMVAAADISYRHYLPRHRYQVRSRAPTIQGQSVTRSV